MRWLALACGALLLAGCDSSPSPDDHSVTADSPRADVEGGDPVTTAVENGPIVSAEPAPRPPASWCPDCDFSQPGDRAGELALYVRSATTSWSGAWWIDGIAIVGPRRTTMLTCPTDFACTVGADELAHTVGHVADNGEQVRFGPGKREFSTSLTRHRIEVRSIDGRVLRKLNLSSLEKDEQIHDLAWSPDSRRVAVTTVWDRSSERPGYNLISRLWIFDADGRHADLLYTSHDGSVAYLTELDWSPTSDTISVLESDEFGHYLPYLVLVGADGSDPRKIYWWASGDGAGTYVWSPDGQRVAVDDGRRLLKLSIVDGQVLGHHRRVVDPVWRASQP